MDTSNVEENFESLIEDADQWIDSVLTTLDWSRDYILQRGVIETCPVNRTHSVPPSALNRHIESCSSQNLGYSNTDPADDSHRFFYENAKKVALIPLDEAVIRQVLSQSGAPAAEELDMAGLSPQQRHLLYQYCITTAKSVNQETSIPEEQLQLLEDKAASDTKKSSLELRAEERDMKRRRQSYKNKASIHTRNKTHTQLIREVITSQTELLAQLWKAEDERKQRKERKSHSDEMHSGRSTRDQSPRHHTRERSPSSHRSRSSRHESRHESRHKSRSRSREDSSERRSKHKKHKKHKHKHHKKKDQDTLPQQDTSTRHSSCAAPVLNSKD